VPGREGIDRLVRAAVHLAAVAGGPGVDLAVAGQVEPVQPQGRNPHRPFADPADHVATRVTQQNRRLGHVDRHDPEFPHPAMIANQAQPAQLIT
jgi:hypothetical protein